MIQKINKQRTINNKFIEKNYYYCHIRKAKVQSISVGTWTPVVFNDTGTDDLEISDVHGWHSLSLNTDRIKPTIAGLYLIIAKVSITPDDKNVRILLGIYKNGITYSIINMCTATNIPEASTCQMFELIELNGTSDYISLYVYQHNNDLVACNVEFAGDRLTELKVIRLNNGLI